MLIHEGVWKHAVLREGHNKRHDMSLQQQTGIIWWPKAPHGWTAKGQTECDVTCYVSKNGIVWGKIPVFFCKNRLVI